MKAKRIEAPDCEIQLIRDELERHVVLHHGLREEVPQASDGERLDEAVVDDVAVIVPVEKLQARRAVEEPDRSRVHDVIFDELVRGVVNPTSKQTYLEIIQRLDDRGAQGVIAGCTEIELLIQAADVDTPFFPTTRLHAVAAVDWALAGD